MPDDIITGACYLIPPQVSGAWLIAENIDYYVLYTIIFVQR